MPKLLICSHRGPVSYRRVDGRLVADRAGPGGLVPVLEPVVERLGGRWTFAAMTDADREAARDTPLRQGGRGVTLHLLDLPEQPHRQHYEVASVGYLGLLFHYLFEPAYTPAFDHRFASAWEGYRAVNQAYAEAALARLDEDVVWVQDYHLMLLAALMRNGRRAAGATPAVYFHHVPWCEPSYFDMLPGLVRDEILEGLLAHDVVAFHSPRWAEAFMGCCERFVPGASCSGGTVQWRDRLVRVVSTPAALDTERVAALLQDPRTEELTERFRRLQAGRWTLVRADRADLWKNVLRGFAAFEALLERRPELAGRVWLLALLTPTRLWLPEYRRYLEACQAAVARINRRFTPRGSSASPVTLEVAANPQVPDRHRALAGLRLADAVLVNSVFDGLNLVAKEGVMASAPGPVLILSRNAGAHDELSEAAIGINPFDITETAVAIERALEMTSAERAARARRLREIVLGRRPEDWASDQLAACGWPDATAGSLPP
jgi:trehalose 6-phosphate synthase